MGSAVSYCSPQQIQTVDLCGSEGKAPESTNLPCPVKYEEINHEAYSKLPCLKCQNWINVMFDSNPFRIYFKCSSLCLELNTKYCW